MTPPSLLPSWSADELAVLARTYSAGGYKAACAALPNRTAVSVLHKARRIGLSRRRRWTPADDVQLRGLWSEGLPLHRVAKELGRTKATTFWRAQKLGLSLGVPPDFEYLTDAARRTGFCATQLRRILAWAGVKFHRTISRPTRSRSGVRFHMIDPLDVDEALARWAATEPVAAAARRHGVSDDQLRARLKRLGVVSRAKKVHLRVTEEQVRTALRGRA